jgi:hypothetical protein
VKSGGGLTDGEEVVSLMRQPRFTPKNNFWYSFLLGVSKPQGHSAAGKIRQIEKFQLPHQN